MVERYAPETPYGQSANLVLNNARNFAYESRQEFIRTDHLLAGIVQQGGCSMTLIRLRAPPLRLWPLIDKWNPCGRVSEPDRAIIGATHLLPSRAYDCIQNKYATRMTCLLNRGEVDPDCLLGGILLLEGCLGAQILHKQGITLPLFLEEMRAYADTSPELS
ncbi:MAG: Clp protease N-terminal domain-containing protein [Nanoarchaeota archaeon]|mgnify:CR=1 FL=1